MHVGVGGKEDYGRKSSLFGPTTVTLVGAASPLGHSRGISLSMMDVSSGENHVLILENGRNDSFPYGCRVLDLLFSHEDP